MLSTYSRRNKNQIRIIRAGKKLSGVSFLCALLGMAVGSASLNGQETGFRLLPKINQETAVDRNTKLFTINDQRSLPPMVMPSKARIVATSDTRVAQVTAPIQTAPTKTAPVISNIEDRGIERENPADREYGRYVVAFSKPLPASPLQDEVDTDVNVELPDLTEPPVPVEKDNAKGDLEPNSAGADEEMTELNDMLNDLKSESASEDQADDSDAKDDLDLDDDSDSGRDDLDDLDEDEDDSPKREELGAWPKRSIQEVRVDASEYGSKIPEDRSDNLFANSKRFGVDLPATDKTFAWAAPNIRYQPLYFEDVSLERYGQTKGLIRQPFVSAIKAFGGGAVLPLRALRDNPYSCDSPLGYCRPGSPTSGQCGCQTGSCESCGR